MSAPRHTALACKLLARTASREFDSPAAEAPSADERAQAIAVLERAIHRRNRRRLTVRWASVAAALVLLGIGARGLLMQRGESMMSPAPALDVASAIKVVGHAAGGGATVVDSDSSSPLTEGKPLARGNRIVAGADGQVVLSLSTGTRLFVEAGGDVAIVDNGPHQVFAIQAGAVRAQVAKLDELERFIIRTPDSDVEVRGTSFRVSVVQRDPGCGGGTTTRVSVYEGVVSVRHAGTEARVAANQSWPADCSARRTPAPVAQPLGNGLAKPIPRTPTSPTGGETPSSSEDSSPVASDLGEQNDSFSRALAAKRRGAAREAVDAFEAFVVHYPSSPMVESALAQRMKLLVTIDSARAHAAAQQYLARYPRGFAASEAESIRRVSP
jgi:hypothetical protein